MKVCYIFLLVFLFIPLSVRAYVFTENLQMGSVGLSVLELQRFLNKDTDTIVATTGPGSLGQETDRFGLLTKIAVIKFQEKYRQEILIPVGIYRGTGIVGPLTRKKLMSLQGFISAVSNQDKQVKNVSRSSSTITISPKTQSPEVFRVSPIQVKAGDRVTVYGNNFGSTTNTVRLRFGQIEARFEQLSSTDGKTISFIFQPPEVKTMNKNEILNLPPNIFNKIMGPVAALGGSVEDIVSPYRNIKTEDELKTFLKNNGHTFEELYDNFFITIENVYGVGTSKTPILSGLRKLPLGQNFSFFDGKSILSGLLSMIKSFTPKVYAQMPGGGFNSGIIMYCTCGEGYLTFMTDFSSNGGSGLYWWSSSFVPLVGSPMISGPYTGFFTQNAGVCVVGVAPYCAEVSGNVASLPWGEGL